MDIIFLGGWLMKSESHNNTFEQTIKYLDEKIKYMECIKDHLMTCKLIELERNMALQQLKDAGLYRR
jgi:hypothetical protein